MKFLYKVMDKGKFYGYVVLNDRNGIDILLNGVSREGLGDLEEIDITDVLNGRFQVRPDRMELKYITSKGNQRKFYQNGYWYKLDFLGYEGKAEWVASEILKYSTLEPTEYITYELTEIDGEWGCKSKNFLNKDEIFVSFYRLFKQNLWDYDKKLDNAGELRSKIQLLIDTVYKFTDVDVTSYLKKIFTLDAFIFNEDRH